MMAIPKFWYFIKAQLLSVHLSNLNNIQYGLQNFHCTHATHSGHRPNKFSKIILEVLYDTPITSAEESYWHHHPHIEDGKVTGPVNDELGNIMAAVKELSSSLSLLDKGSKNDASVLEGALNQNNGEGTW
jgi:hypothetical protein